MSKDNVQDAPPSFRCETCGAVRPTLDPKALAKELMECAKCGPIVLAVVGAVK